MSEIEKLADYLCEVRRVTGKWPKSLILHPTADVEAVQEAIVLARGRWLYRQHRVTKHHF